MSFAETALASGLGAAVGAWAAFRFNWHVETRKKRNAEILAGHVALALFRSKLLYADMVDKAWKAGQQDRDACALDYLQGSGRLPPSELHHPTPRGAWRSNASTPC